MKKWPIFNHFYLSFSLFIEPYLFLSFKIYLTFTRIINYIKLTFNIPNLIEKFIEGSNGNTGTIIKAGLPNIIGDFISQYTISAKDNSTTTGALRTYNTSTSGYFGTGIPDNLWGYGFSFDASRSSSIYGNSSTVQPNSLSIMYVIRFL